MVKVLIADKMSPKAAEIFRDRGVDVDEKPGMSPDELKACIAEYDGLAVRSATKVTPEILAAADNLKVIGRAGIGVDNINVPEATNRGVVVMNTPFGNSITTAEHAISMMMALARNIPAANASTQAGKWEKSKFMGVEVHGKVLGIIGCGNIGQIVADRALGLKMRVLGYDPFLSEDRARELGIRRVELDELFAKSDFITLHTPLTDQTRGIVGKAAFDKMKPGARLVNCARGGLVDEAALKEALDSGKIAGAALDVFAEEPAKENALFGTANFVATPHLGASTTEAQVNVAIQVAEQMSDYLLTGGVTNALNMPSLSAEEAPLLQPYMKLAEQVGGFAGQITESSLKKARIEYEGHVATLNTKPLTAVVLEGLLAPLMDSVNMVNAPVIARERDIEVAEVKHDRAGDYHTLIRLTVETDRGERTVSGTLFANEAPRIVRINDVPIEARLSQHMLYVTNNDKPGFIGALGSTLGEAGINIARFSLGRPGDDGPDGIAVALVAVDQPVGKEVLDKINALTHVRQAKALRF
ncbi:D-3-phosphoglycerate dehydrogenase [Rhodothalassium salexigens DSM 2132]|uniref:D-3-phosphoglycerate dehydrogenase n=1 Tax=Rhodothalassium salexigens DSM 2132 TaxID=1188247 RepID=A0A4R2PPQ3_RHOSA|nr:phosphoglycerate dehydrogenase [Rhodothalassium salexigens]MBB4210701.1 D-3-phosphoglycerate dehydrogenase [Rhodothalassium salexigens DSM 2132]MBK1637902.1 phosphoglycerate dehydrogenase [Rhodothalassium salexigens DSM 2132]TCP37743.1 D-3-phosphoglycerate dehydrogenase [Rhodothalassium salexigens DSM 2132]